MKIALRILSVLMFLALTGCASNYSPEPQHPEKLNATHGFVYSPKVQSSFFPLDRIELRSLQDGKSYILQQYNASPGGYGLWIPAGDYELVEMFKDSSEKHSFPPIQVKAGEFTDIGGLLWVSVGQDKKVLLPIHHPELDLKARQAEEMQASYLADQNIHQWKPDSVAKPVDIEFNSPNLGLVVDLIIMYGRQLGLSNLNRPLTSISNAEDFFAEAKRLQPPITHTGVSGLHGEQYFGADLGQIRVRGADGSWSSLDTGTLDSITAIAIDQQGVVAGTSGGAIFKGNGRKWKRIARIPEDQEILGLTHTSDGWLILAGLVASNDYPILPTVYGMSILHAKDDFSKINVIKNFSLKDKFDFVKISPKYVNGKYLINTFDDLYELDVSTGNWRPVGPGHEMTSFNIDKRSGIFTAYKAQGIFSKLSISSDSGKTWSKVNTPGISVLDIMFETPSQATAIGFEIGVLNQSAALYKFEPINQTSSIVSSAKPALCRNIVSDEDMRTFFCVSGNGSILRFDDKKLAPELILD